MLALLERSAAVGVSGRQVLKCQAVGCPGRRAVGLPLCGACWIQVHPRLRVDVYESWRRLQRDSRPAAFTAHIAAVAAALDNLPGVA